ncbi:MAG: hypothetical protein DI632_09755 [Sphingomonas hengshuiensis]|uniref:Uncharacterized protein n=1 Tax=Sphingomonas hengshuiensis TaxID=1609977 RepID=A0A2W5B1S2_9SPHN|nr:MAG: hypothetical protein DI632_09755 [Sphingomonas hengshuiensis]
MTDAGKQPNQAMGGQPGAATPDGVNNAPSGGESGGDAYPNPHDGDGKGRFDGGQSVQDYHGGPGGERNQGAGTGGQDPE